MFFLLTMLACLGHYWVEYQRAPAGDYKSRTKWFLIAYAGALLASWDFMPNFGVALYPIGYLSVFCWLVFVERAIWRYQLIDITPAFAAEHIFKMMADALLVFDQEEVVQLANEAACELLGRPRAELIGRRLSGLGDCVFDTKQFMVGATSGYEMKLADTRRGELVLDLTSSPIRDRIGRLVGTVCIARDVTERKRAEQMIRETEERFRQSQKMEAIGRLAGGVAHDFNNALTVILGYSSTLANRLQSDDVLRRDAEEIMRAGSRAASLTRQLLAFSRKQVLQPKVLDLNAVLKGLEPMLRRLIGEDVELIITTISGRAYVKVDHGQVEQIIMNLAVNARDAMPRGGTLTIGTKAGFGRDAEVLLIVTDTGCGMDAETQTHIFEPFFTTKDKGKGTGLGLSTVYGIVKQSGGQITVESQLGLGSTFVISFPLAVETAVPEEVGKAAEVQTGTETILLVEDEQAVRALIRDTLGQQGYKVLEASDSKQAFIVAGHHELDIHLLLTDVIMPVMSGRELAERFSSSRPKMRVLYISGYTDDDVVRHGILKGSHAFLQKPFTPEVLLVKVRQVLDEPASKRQTVSTALR
jgi:PAS domain S-box-containing protein